MTLFRLHPEEGYFLVCCSIDTVCDDPGTATDASDSLWTISHVQTVILLFVQIQKEIHETSRTAKGKNADPTPGILPVY